MFRNLVLITLIVAFVINLLSAFVRLTDAGLGCAGWPSCYGTAAAEDSAAKSAYPLVDETKRAIRLMHRLFATLLGLMIAGIGILAFNERDRPGRARRRQCFHRRRWRRSTGSTAWRRSSPWPILAALAARLARVRQLAGYGAALSGLALAQAGLGIANVLSGLPLLAVLAHNALGALLADHYFAPFLIGYGYLQMS